MNDVLTSLAFRGLPDWMLFNQDIGRFSGKKAVIAVMAADRNHPEFKKAAQLQLGLRDDDELVLVAEDHPQGPLHARFHCKPFEFCLALIDKTGNAIMRGNRVPALEMIRRRLALEHA